MPEPKLSLDQARQAWLADLRRTHDRSPTPASTLAVARGEWMCGDYAEALGHFAQAASLAPDDLDGTLALLRAASALGRRAIETEALRDGLSRHPASPEIALHHALTLLPADPAQARDRLAAFPGSPQCRQYREALDRIVSGTRPEPRSFGDPRMDSGWAGFRWAFERAGPAVFRGMPVDVLEAACDAAPDTIDDAWSTLECGVYFGRSLGLIAARTPGLVHGFDSFQGLPEAWSGNEPAGAYSTAGRLPRVAPNVRLHAGWFEHTLPAFFAAHPGPVRLLHVDCDLYSSTRTVLQAAAGRIVPGTILLFDDFLGYPGFEAHELRAFEEHAAAHGLRWEIVAAALLGREVAIRILPPGQG